MSDSQFHILALEPDAARGERLKRLVRQRLGVRVIVARSADAAVASMASRLPDVVLLSALVPPQEEAQLLACLKGLDPDGQVPVLSVPPLTESEAPAARRRFPIFGRSQKPSWPLFDTGAVAERIEEALAQVRSARSGRSLDLAGRAVESPPVGINSRDAEVAAASVILPLDQAMHDRAHRFGAGGLPWLSHVETVWGLDVRVLNISRSGMLMEASSKLDPGSSTTFRLCGPDGMRVVPARVVRAEVGDVGRLGVSYYVAAVFDRGLDLLPEGSDLLSRSPATPQALAALLARVTGDLVRGQEAACAAYADGLRQMVPVREIMFRDEPVTSPGCNDSVYFTVPSLGGRQAVLQVVFEPNQAPTARDMKLLRAAAGGAVILFYEAESSATGDALAADSMALARVG